MKENTLPTRPTGHPALETENSIPARPPLAAYGRLLVTIVAALAIGTAPAWAAIIAYEGFDYDRRQWFDGNDDGEGIAGLDGGTGWGGPWTSLPDRLNAGIPEGEDDFGDGAGARTSPLSYTDNFGNPLVTTGNQVRTAFGNNSWDRRPLADPLGEVGSTVWVSFLGQAHGQAGENRWAFVELSVDGGDRLWLGNVNPVTSGNWGVFLPDRSEEAISEDAGGDFPMNEQTLFLMRLDFGNDPSESTDVTVWMNPPDITDESALQTPVFQLDTDYATYNQVGVAGRFSTDFDEIRIGTSFDSVTPIPEPSTYALIFGIGVFGILLLRRRASRHNHC